MALKMAPNSLFAVLLRSPWWVSLSIAGVISLLSGAFMPDGYKLVGALSTLPFVVIGVMAARKQWSQPSPAEVTATVESLQAMAWPAFESALREALGRDGYAAPEGKAAPRRGPADLVLERQGALTVISARRWKAARLGVEVLRELQDTRRALEADRALCVALGEATEAARDYARQEGIQIWGPAELAQALRRR